MIFGIGTDICRVDRLTRLLEKYGDKTARRILGGHELDDYKKAYYPARFLAKRHAAKEAFSKALGTGIRAPATLSAIRVDHDELGKPIMCYGPALHALMTARGLEAHISISDEAEYAVAFVVIERKVS
jgi:holo-[acyl-carrier protein] synthase